MNLLTRNLLLASLASTLVGHSINAMELEKNSGEEFDLTSYSPLDYELIKTLELRYQITSLSCSPDGENLLVGYSNHTEPLVWTIRTGEKVTTFQGTPHYSNSVAFSPSGTRCVTGSTLGIAYLWDSKTGELIKTLQGHTAAITSLTFSRDEKTILTSSWDTTARLWDATTGKPIATIKANEWVFSAAFSPDGETILTGLGINSAVDRDPACLWNTKTGDLITTLKGHTDWIVAVAFSPDGKTCLTGSRDHTACLWDVKTGDLITTLKGHTDEIKAVAFNKTGEIIVTGSEDKTACVWNAKTGGLITTLKGHTFAITAVTFSSDGETIITGSRDDTARLWKPSCQRATDESLSSSSKEDQEDDTESHVVKNNGSGRDINSGDQKNCSIS